MIRQPSRPRVLHGLLGLLLALVSPAVRADGEGAPLEETFELELVYPQEKGEWQLTFAPEFSSGEGNTQRLPVVVEYGLSDLWQVGVSADAWVRVEPDGSPSTDGLGDVRVEIQRTWMDVREGLHLGLSFGVGYPLGNVEDGTTEGTAEYEAAVLFARELPGARQLILIGQLGAALVDPVDELDDIVPGGLVDDDEEANELEYGVGLLIPFERLVASIEWSGSGNRWDGGDEQELYVTAGLTGALSDAWELGVGVGAGLTDDSDDVRARVLLTTEF